MTFSSIPTCLLSCLLSYHKIMNLSIYSLLFIFYKDNNYDFIILIKIPITIVKTIITRHNFATLSKNAIPIIQDSNTAPIARIVQPRTILPEIVSDQTIIEATMNNTTTKNIFHTTHIKCYSFHKKSFYKCLNFTLIEGHVCLFIKIVIVIYINYLLVFLAASTAAATIPPTTAPTPPVKTAPIIAPAIIPELFGESTTGTSASSSPLLT